MGGAAGCARRVRPSLRFCLRDLAYAHELSARGLLELETVGRKLFVQREFGDLQVKAVVIVRTLDANLARERVEAARRCGNRNLLVADERLPIGNMNVGKQNAFWAEGLQTRDLQIGAIEPDLAEDLGAIAATEFRQDVITRGFV